MNPRYLKVHVNISDSQKARIKEALQNQEAVVIRLAYEDFRGDDILAITKTQQNKIEKAARNNKGTSLKLSPAQIRYNLKIEGGFLGMLAGLAARALPFLFRSVAPALATGALSGIGSFATQKLMKSGEGLYLKKGGNICKVETDGTGLYLYPSKGSGLNSKGDGLYLRQKGKTFDGAGLLLGENSPFKNIPVLGWIL